MPTELIVGLVVILVWRILAGMKIPVLSALLRGIWNLCFTVSSFIPFFGWAAHFIIADTAAEKKNKDELIEVGDTMDGMVNAPWSDGYTPNSGKGSLQTGDVVRGSDGEDYRVRREGHLVYLEGRNGTKVVDTDFADVDGQSSFSVDGTNFVR